MAWIVKNSGTAEIDRREEPYLTAEIKAHFDKELIPRYERKQGAMLPLLHVIQKEHKFIPFQAMEEIAEYLGTSTAEVYDTASFYEQFFTDHAIGTHLIQVCQSISCELCGSTALLKKIEEKLGIIHHETTPDGKFTLLALECLGSCGTAPAVLVNETLYEDVTWEQLDKIIDELPDE